MCHTDFWYSMVTFENLLLLLVANHRLIFETVISLQHWAIPSLRNCICCPFLVQDHPGDKITFLLLPPALTLLWDLYSYHEFLSCWPHQDARVSTDTLSNFRTRGPSRVASYQWLHLISGLWNILPRELKSAFGFRLRRDPSTSQLILRGWKLRISAVWPGNNSRQLISYPVHHSLNSFVYFNRTIILDFQACE